MQEHGVRFGEHREIDRDPGRIYGEKATILVDRPQASRGLDVGDRRIFGDAHDERARKVPIDRRRLHLRMRLDAPLELTEVCPHARAGIEAQTPHDIIGRQITKA